MLAHATPFPFAGSQALYGDRHVRIQRVEADGRRLIIGTGRPQLCKTVEVEELADAAQPADPIASWLGERVDRDTPGALAAFVDLYDDFAAFCGLRGIAAADIVPPIVFGRRIHYATGAKTTIRRLPDRPNAARCLPFRLLDKADAA